MIWSVYTHGPAPIFEGSVEDVVRYIEDHTNIGMKRGWRRHWSFTTADDGRVGAALVVKNSVGKEVNTVFAVQIYPKEMSNHQKEMLAARKDRDKYRQFPAG